MAFLSAQVILGTEEVQCPGRILFSFVWDLLHDNPDQWEELKSNQTVMRAFVCLLDVLERNLYTPLNLNSKKADSLRQGYILAFRLFPPTFEINFFPSVHCT